MAAEPGGASLQWTQWQLLDSILPTGGFAHSYGLEAFAQARMVTTPEDLRQFVVHVLDNTGSLLLPFVYSAAKSPDADTFASLDRLLDATLTNEVGRKASASQGAALMRVAASAFRELPLLRRIRESSSSSFHHAAVFGVVCGQLGFELESTQRAYMFMAMRDVVVSAATRLNLIGPLAAAAMQHEMSPAAEEMVRRWMNRRVEEAAQTHPLLDAVQGCHGYLFSRLFCS